LFNEINLEVEKWRLENKYKISESQVLEYKESLIKDKNPFADINDVLDAIDHINNLVGIEHIGFGSDFDGLGNTLPTKLKNASNYPNLIEGLLNRNYSKDSIEKICYKNLFRVWETNLQNHQI
jgi:membrane dipeptidase